MKPVYDVIVRLRKEIIEIVAYALSDWMQGKQKSLPVVEIHSAIEQRIADAIHEAVQDAIREMQTD